MKYLYLILVIGFVSCSSNNNSNEVDESKNYEQEPDTSQVVPIEPVVGDDYQLNDSNSSTSSATCQANTLFEEELSLPLKINYDFFTMYDNIGDKVFIPYECVNDGKEEIVEGLPMNIFYAYGKVQLADGKDYYLVIETGNPDNPMDLLYTSAILFSNNNGVLGNGIEIGKYHAYSGVQEYYDGQLNMNGTINQHISKIGNDGISESVFEERDTSFSIIK